MALIGPKKKPTLKKGDFHILVNDDNETAKVYDHTGKLLFKRAALAKGWNGRTTWKNGGDTPPGLYKAGTLYKWDAAKDTLEELEAYGDICYDLEEQEGQENVRGRAGISLHGGRPGRGHQDKLRVTSGCVRMFNDELINDILPLTHYWDEAQHRWRKRDNVVWVSVYQDYD